MMRRRKLPRPSSRLLTSLALIFAFACDVPEDGDGFQLPDAVDDLTAPTVDADAPLSVKPDLAHARVRSLDGGPDGIEGKLVFVPSDAGGLAVSGSIEGFADAGFHGMHIHEIGDCSAADGSSAGGHFAPHDRQHGARDASTHVGDLGNLTVVESGVARVETSAPGATLSGPAGIVGRAVIVHADIDDLASQPSGDAGPRIACGVIRQGAG